MADEQNSTVSEYLYGQVLESNGLEAFLNAVTRLAVLELSGPEDEVFCGVTLLRHKKAGTIASSSEAAQAVDELQYDYQDGPCLTSARTQGIVISADLEADERWPEYGKEAGRRGVRSVLAIPLEMEGQDAAALNIYSTTVGFFTQDRMAAGQAYARQAARALKLSVRLADHREAEAHALEAMKSRTTIDLAVGIIMGQNRCSQDEAFSILVSASSTRNIKLREVASFVVGSTTKEETSTHFEP